MSDITIYENLANAIILQAVKDYRMALKSLKANSRNRAAQADKAEIERLRDEQLVLRYRYLDDCTWEEISRMLNVSLRTVHRIHGSALQHFSVPE